MRTAWAIIVSSGLFVSAGPLTAAGPVVTNLYENLDAQHALRDVPVTFSRIGADGDFVAGITPAVDGRKLPAQVDVLRRAPDGSIRHALVSFVLPRLAAGGTVKIDWYNEAPAAPPAFAWGGYKESLPVKLSLQPAKGGMLVSDLGALVPANWAGGGRVKVLHDGPVMKEFEVADVPVDAEGKPDPEIEIIWRVRAFSGQESVRVAAIVERCKPRRPRNGRPLEEVHPSQYKFAGVELTLGDKTLYKAGAYDHLDQTRYRILAWTGGVLEGIHRRPDYDYWVRGRFFPKYRLTEPMTPEKVDRIFTKPEPPARRPIRKPQGILENGMIYNHMPGTGGRWEMEPYPAWAVCYLLAGGSKTYQAMLHADGNGGGAFYIHVRQDGLPGYNVFTVKIKPLDTGYRMPLYQLPDGTKPEIQPDHAHAPSLGYISYLLTGDRFYAEEASFWAAHQMGEWPHKGMRWQSMDRAFAYGLRHVVDAAFILPQSDPLQAYFEAGVNKCLDEMTAQCVNNGRRVHAPVATNFKSSGRPYWVNAKHTSVWQYAWSVWSLGNAADKGFAKAAKVRDWAAEYIVGFYTSTDQFTGPDGKVYRYDPRDAVAYSTATEVVPTEIVAKPDGPKEVRPVQQNGRVLENYGEIWYYTKLNVDNCYVDPKGLTTAPDAQGNWPLRPDGWGGGMTWNPVTGKQERWWNWHRYGAWVGLVAALDGDVPDAKKAWKTMLPMAGTQGIYGYEMVPRTGLPQQ